MQMSADALAQCNENPLYRTIGIRLDAVADGNAHATMTPNASVCWPTPGQPHGGILFTVMDTTMAFAALSNADDGSGCATVDCSIQYPAPARHAPFTCRATTLRRSGRTVFVRAEVLDATQGIVALGQATFRLLAPKHG